MASYPVEIRRCEHIRGSGGQCGSPALRGEKFCYYHEQCQPKHIKTCDLDDDPYSSGEIKMPALDDAHAIQYVIRQVSILLLQKRIDTKHAGLLLYGLQIASSNLRMMKEEKPRPTQVVVDREKVGETPMGMTPWSASGEGHDPENEEAFDDAERAETLAEENETIMESLDTERARRLRAEELNERMVGKVCVGAANVASFIRNWLALDLTKEQWRKYAEDLLGGAEHSAKVESWEENNLPPLEMVRGEKKRREEENRTHNIQACAQAPEPRARRVQRRYSTTAQATIRAARLKRSRMRTSSLQCRPKR